MKSKVTCESFTAPEPRAAGPGAPGEIGQRRTPAPIDTPTTHWARQPDATAHVLLANLVRALEPFVVAAAPSAPAQLTSIAVELTTAAPTTAQMICSSASGPDQRFVAVGSGDVGAVLALAMGAIVEAGLNRLPADQRRGIARAVERGIVRLRLDPVFLVVTAHLELPGLPPVALFVLDGDTTH